MTDLPRRQILIGDARERLRELPDASVDCVITSPPYFALRDYGHDQQIGAESHIDAWVADIVAACHELWRVLKPTGALWLNLGDGYSRHPREGAQQKSLLLGPQRVALQLTQNGWILRNHVIWAKRNPMPSSVTDRLSCTHESIYFFSKQSNYYFDLQAIREPTMSGTQRKPQRSTSSYPPRQAVPSVGRVPRVDLNQGIAAMRAEGRSSHPLGKNPGDVWHLATASYHGAHFATFPVELVRRPLLATCPPLVCAGCGQPARRTMQVIGSRKFASGPRRLICDCRAGSRPGVVLDAFMGAGTVALAAEAHDRDWVGIELNPTYAALAKSRLARWRRNNAT